MCSITPETANVGSSYNRIRGPGIGCWFSDRSNCSHWSLTLTFTLTSENLSLYITLLLVLVLIHLDSNYSRTRCRQSQPGFVLSPLLLHPRLLGRSSRIFRFSRWLGQLSTVLTSTLSRDFIIMIFHAVYHISNDPQTNNIPPLRIWQLHCCNSWNGWYQTYHVIVVIFYTTSWEYRRD